MESLKLSFPSSGRSFIYCVLSVHTTPRRRSRPPPFLHPAADKAAQVVRICCSAAVATTVSPSRCLAQAAWSWKACAGSLKEGQGANGRPRAAKGAHPADSPAAVPSCPLLSPLAPSFFLLRPSHASPSHRSPTVTPKLHSLAAQAAQHPNPRPPPLAPPSSTDSGQLRMHAILDISSMREGSGIIILATRGERFAG
jgi:hypothetical protein